MWPFDIVTGSLTKWHVAAGAWGVISHSASLAGEAKAGAAPITSVDHERSFIYAGFHVVEINLM
jgi:hypothetical protein